jgi:hypothetical protein
VQLDYVIPTEQTFGDQYTYLTGSSRTLVNFYTRLAGELVEKLAMSPGDVVVEIGSNDGTFLNAFRDLGMEVLGVEGASQAVAVAMENGIPTIDNFFGVGTSQAIKDRLPQGRQIKLIAAMSVLAHTDNINEFLPEVKSLMGPETVFISQSHWLIELIRKFEFDTIYHEHLRYYTLESLMNLFQRHNLHVNDAEVTEFYGGSILTYSMTGSGSASKELLSLVEEEKQIDVVQALRDMKLELLGNKARLQTLLVEIKTSGKKVVGIGAPMKASTLLNFYGITSDLIEYIVEVNQLKIGTVVPGVHIPVVHEDILFEEQPDYAILLTWNMASDIIPKLRSGGYRGKIIVPVPSLEVIE